jgi:hypothetical protein
MLRWSLPLQQQNSHATLEAMNAVGLSPPQMAISRKPRLRPWYRQVKQLVYPLPNYQMWRGNHWSYLYNKSTVGNWGESGTNDMYHQHFAHAKCPTDYGRGGREFEYLSVKQGKQFMKPLPTVQYASSKPKFRFKSWHAPLASGEMWQREIEHDGHIPMHIGAKRPLAIMSPVTMHKHIFLAHIEKITVTICPFLFGYGHTIQKAVLDFYRRALSARSPYPKDKIFLNYTVDRITPRIDVTWLDGTVYTPPMLEGCTCQDLIQMVMETAWLQADKMDAAGRQLQPLAIDDFKWEQLIVFKKKREKDAKGAKKPGAK